MMHLELSRKRRRSEDGGAEHSQGQADSSCWAHRERAENWGDSVSETKQRRLTKARLVKFSSFLSFSLSFSHSHSHSFIHSFMWQMLSVHSEDTVLVAEGKSREQGKQKAFGLWELGV